MKKLWLILLLAALLSGCRNMEQIKPDTIVDIPLHPTQQATVPVSEPAAATQPATEAPTDPVQTEQPTDPVSTVPPKDSSGGNTGGGKKPGKGDSGSKAPVQPPSTQPPTQPLLPTEPLTEPPVLQPTEPAGYDPSGYSPGSRDRAVADAVNAQRQEAGLEPLTLDSQLCAIASVRAYELSLSWSNVRPDGSGGLTVLGEYGYSYGWAAECLYYGGGNPDSIAAKWMNTPSGAEKLLSQQPTVIGVGSYTTADGLVCVAAILAG